MSYLDQNVPLESALDHLANVLRVELLFSTFHSLLLIVLWCGTIRFSFSESPVTVAVISESPVTVAVINAVGGNWCIVSRGKR